MQASDLQVGGWYWVVYKPFWSPIPTGTPQIAQWDPDEEVESKPLRWWIVGCSSPEPFWLWQVLEGPLKAPSLPQEPLNARE